MAERWAYCTGADVEIAEVSVALWLKRMIKALWHVMKEREIINSLEKLHEQE